jgi:hypothetical protein
MTQETIVNDTRTCTLCKTEKSMEEFDGKTVYYCKPCRKGYRSSDKERRAARALHLKRFYSITLEDFERLVAEQNGKCAICGETPQGILRVDHNHKTGRVRGLLCDPCNVGLGAFRDNPVSLIEAVKYLAIA